MHRPLFTGDFQSSLPLCLSKQTIPVSLVPPTQAIKREPTITGDAVYPCSAAPGTGLSSPKKCRAEVPHEVDAPYKPTITGAQALQFTFAGLRIKEVAIHHRRAARSGGALFIFERIVHRCSPKLASIGGV